jgi:hypothetical protein
MLITYIVLIIIAIVFKLLHWPGGSLILLFSILFPLIDILIQSLRKKEDKIARIYSAISLFLLAVFIQFKLLTWPGGIPLLFFGLLLAGFSFYHLNKKKSRFSVRFILFAAVILFALFNASLKTSTLKLAYSLEDPFDSNTQVPTFWVQQLAYDFYREGDYKKAEFLIQKNINHIERMLKQEDVEDFLRDIDEKNLEQSKLDLKQLKNRKWSFNPLIPEDRQE